VPSAIQKRSYGSVTVYSIHESTVWDALNALVADLGQRPEVLAVVLFGSLGAGQMGVGSDVDLLIVLSHSDQPFLERTLHYKPDTFPVDLDVFPYTLQEIQGGNPLAQEALTQGRTLWQRPGFSLAEEGRQAVAR
jgi:uncharacterized protein